jgi:AcrR family transcriptional regulator
MNGKKTPAAVAKPRGRPRGFDEAAVLDSLLDVFWQKGFSSASLEDLESAAGINRPSLYAAFGDKRSMYLRALAAFEARMEAALAPALDPARPLRTGFRQFYLRALDMYAEERRAPRGCLVFGTAVVEAADDARVRSALAATLERVDEALRRRFAQARTSGELPSGVSVAGQVALAAALLHSLSLRARAGAGRPQLQELIEAALLQLFGAVRRPAARRAASSTR